MSSRSTHGISVTFKKPRAPKGSAPKRSPWGPVQTAKRLADGIWSVTTSSHGGIKLDAARNALVAEPWRRKGGWYEEDCEWAIVALTFHTDAGFSLEHVGHAARTAKDYWPDEYQAIHGQGSIDPCESLVLRERAAREAARGKLHALSCWGSWSVNVPDGHVGVFARVDGREGAPGVREGYFVLPDAWYRNHKRGTVRVVPDDAIEVRAEDGRCPFGSPHEAIHSAAALGTPEARTA